MGWGNRNSRGGNRRGGGGRGRGRSGRGNGGGNSDWEKVAQVALWDNESGNGNAPILVGSLEMEDGRKLNVSLWESTSDHPDAPQLVGTVTRRVGGEEQRGQRERDYGDGPDGDFDDDIPF